MYFRQEIGKWGENLACKYLEQSNYRIMERNFLCRQGEIDIIAEDSIKKELVFIEVKTRSNLKYGNPIEAVTKEKIKHMRQAANYFVYKNGREGVAIRMDVIEIFLEKHRCRVNHIKQVL